jgi:hypothetical protein
MEKMGVYKKKRISGREEKRCVTCESATYI